MKLPLCACLALASTACGAGTSPGLGGVGEAAVSSSIKGTIAGKSIPVVDVVAESLTRSGSHMLLLAATNEAGTCGILQRGGRPRSATAFLLTLSRTIPVTPGVYLVGPSQTQTSDTVQVAYDAEDASCQSTIDAIAIAGSVSLEEVTADHAKATFDVTFPGGDHVTGTIDAPVCTVDPNTVNSGSCGS
jgi:hypothetical protein